MGFAKSSNPNMQFCLTLDLRLKKARSSKWLSAWKMMAILEEFVAIWDWKLRELIKSRTFQKIRLTVWLCLWGISLISREPSNFNTTLLTWLISPLSHYSTSFMSCLVPSLPIEWQHYGLNTSQSLNCWESILLPLMRQSVRRVSKLLTTVIFRDSWKLFCQTSSTTVAILYFLIVMRSCFTMRTSTWLKIEHFVWEFIKMVMTWNTHLTPTLQWTQWRHSTGYSAKEKDGLMVVSSPLSLWKNRWKSVKPSSGSR